MDVKIRSMEVKLLALLGGSFLALFLILAAFRRSVTDFLPLMAGLFVLSGSVCVLFIRTARKRFRDLLRAMRDDRAPSIRTSKTRDEVDRLASSVWQLLSKRRQSEQKYKDLVENSHGLIVTADLDRNITFVNKRVKETLGYEPEQLIGTPLFRACHPEDLERADRAFRQVIAGERLWDFEARYHHRSGHWVDFLGNVSPIHGPGERVQGVLIAAVEVTEMKKLGRHLQLLQNAVESSTDAISISDLESEILYINPAGARVFGYTRDELIGNNARALSLLSEERFVEFRRRVREQGKWLGRSTLKRKDGSTFCCEYSLTVIKDGQGQPFALVWVGRDVTERLHAEERLRGAQKMETVGILAGGIAHDFNNLLGGIVGYASILKSSLPKESQEHRYASLIEKAGARASELTSTLLSFARKGKGRPFPTDLNNLVKEAVSLFEAPMKKDGNVRSSFLPQRIVVEANPTQIHQAILNVLMNARDAAGAGGTIQVKTYIEQADAAFCELHPECRPGRYAVVSVADDGPGMDDETKRKAFEPFFTTKADRRRTGLGLPITYNIIKNHEGCIDVQTELGQGTAVRIYLPLSDKQLPAPTPAPEVAQGSETLLVIDDDEMIRNVLSDMLSKLGYRVILASSSQAGIDVYRQTKADIDLVIIDMVLADTGGDETFRQLKGIDARLKAIVSSAYPFDTKASKMLQEGARGFIHKPYNLQELSSAVRQALDRE